MKTCSPELRHWLTFSIFEPEKTLREVLDEAEALSPTEWRDFNREMVEPFGQADVLAELRKLIATHDDSTLVSDFVKPIVTE